jgi:hypothetical protein
MLAIKIELRVYLDFKLYLIEKNEERVLDDDEILLKAIKRRQLPRNSCKMRNCYYFKRGDPLEDRDSDFVEREGGHADRFEEIHLPKPNVGVS